MGLLNPFNYLSVAKIFPSSYPSMLEHPNDGEITISSNSLFPSGIISNHQKIIV